MLKLARTTMLGAAVFFILLMPFVATAAQQPPPKPADSEYVPVTGGEQEQLPAAPLVIGAYGVVWLAVVLYLWSIWRRLSHVEREIAQVARRVESGGSR